MPLVPFASLPDDARVWVFAAMAPLDEVDEPRLLAAVDGYLLTWKAHGAALTCAREFREEYFLAVGVDESASGASGCSVDGLFRVLKGIEDGIGTMDVSTISADHGTAIEPIFANQIENLTHHPRRRIDINRRPCRSTCAGGPWPR